MTVKCENDVGTCQRPAGHRGPCCDTDLASDLLMAFLGWLDRETRGIGDNLDRTNAQLVEQFLADPHKGDPK